MDKNLEEYLNGNETGFYESNYGDDETPCIYYHFEKNEIHASDVLKISESGNLILFSLSKELSDNADLKIFQKSLSKENGYSVFKTVSELKTLEKFMLENN